MDGLKAVLGFIVALTVVFLIGLALVLLFANGGQGDCVERDIKTGACIEYAE